MRLIPICGWFRPYFYKAMKPIKKKTKFKEKSLNRSQQAEKYKKINREKKAKSQ